MKSKRRLPVCWREIRSILILDQVKSSWPRLDEAKKYIIVDRILFCSIEDKGHNMGAFEGLSLGQFMQRFKSLPIEQQAIVRHRVLSKKLRGNFPHHIIQFLESLGSEHNESDTSISPPAGDGV